MEEQCEAGRKKEVLAEEGINISGRVSEAISGDICARRI